MNGKSEHLETLLPNLDDPRIANAITSFRQLLRMRKEPLIYVRAHTRRWQAKWKKPKPPKDEVQQAVKKFEKTLIEAGSGMLVKLR